MIPPDVESERSAATPQAMAVDMAAVSRLINGRAAHCAWHQEWMPGRPLRAWDARLAAYGERLLSKPSQQCPRCARIDALKADADHFGHYDPP